jgi:hypothetical protein
MKRFSYVLSVLFVTCLASVCQGQDGSVACWGIVSLPTLTHSLEAVSISGDGDRGGLSVIGQAGVLVSTQTLGVWIFAPSQYAPAQAVLTFSALFWPDMGEDAPPQTVTVHVLLDTSGRGNILLFVMDATGRGIWGINQELLGGYVHIETSE